MLELLADACAKNRPDGVSRPLRGSARFDQIIVMDDGRIIERVIMQTVSRTRALLSV